MGEPIRVASIPTQSARKQANDRLARRATTAAISAAIFLAGTLTGVASTAQVAARTGARLVTQREASGSTELAQALTDYQAAVAAHQAATSAAAPRLRAPSRVAPRRSNAPTAVAVTGAS